MATSEVEICNDALILLGADKISSLSDNSREAVLCNEQYAKVRNQLMGSHPWNFATYRTELAADAVLPVGYWKWTYAHSLGSDVLRVLRTETEEEEWVVEGRKLFANYSPVKIEFIKLITDTSKYPIFFEEALAHKLAQRLCYAITQSNSFLESVRKDAEQALREARSYDAQEKSLQRVEAEDWINIRF